MRRSSWQLCSLFICLVTAPVAQGADYFLSGQGIVSLSSRGSDSSNGESEFDAFSPAIARDPATGTTLFVWSGDDASTVAADPDTSDNVVPHLVNNEFEIFARALRTTNASIGRRQVRVSTMGDDLESDASKRRSYGAFEPAVVWNPVAEEFLVVWRGDSDSAPLVDDEFEIFGQRMDASGKTVGKTIQISKMVRDSTGDGDTRRQFGAFHPAVAVDAESGNWLVVWHGTSDKSPLVPGENEIFGRLVASDGTFVSAQQRISVTGDDSETVSGERSKWDALNPAVAFNPVSGNFVVVWESDDSLVGLANNEFEIFMQQVAIDGTKSGSAVRVSSMGPGGDPDYDAGNPALAVDDVSGSVFVAWEGESNEGSLVEGEQEIFGALLDSLGAELYSSRISKAGTDSETVASERQRFSASHPKIGWNATSGHFLAVWRADSDKSPFVDDEFEIYGQFLGADGPSLSAPFRISTMGDHDADATSGTRRRYTADEPAIVAAENFFTVSWSGDSNGTGSIDGKLQVFARDIAYEYTTLETTVLRPIAWPVAPAPIVLRLVVENTGNNIARDVAMTISNSSKFDFTVDGCSSFSSSDGVCLIGDIKPGKTAEVNIEVKTDGIQLGDEQATVFNVVTHARTALKEPELASKEFFAATTVVEGSGGGSLGLLGLVLIFGLGVFTARRR